jgi:hypothetical protein
MTLTQVKKKCWKEFSAYIRLRDCLETTGKTTEGLCYTCGRVYPNGKVGGLQAGHFIPGRHNSILFDFDMVKSQCLTAESKIRLFNGTNKSISCLSVGDRLWSFDEGDFTLAVGVVDEVNSFIPDRLYMVVMEDGSTFYATPDHRVVANGKWIKIQDMLHNQSAYDILEL